MSPTTLKTLPANGRVEYVLETLLPMLRNDLRAIVESGCSAHGTAGSGPNFATLLLCLMACEVLGMLFHPGGKEGKAASKWFIEQIGVITGERRYLKHANLIIVFFRNGIAHSFLPKKHKTVNGSAVWRSRADGGSACVDWLTADPDGRRAQAILRKKSHLTLRKWKSGVRAFQIAPQVFYVDLIACLDSFERRLIASEYLLCRRVQTNFLHWVSANERVHKKDINKLEEKWLLS